MPGSITDSTVRGSRVEAEADFPSCIPSGTAGDWNQAPVNISLLEHASVPVLHESGSSAGTLSRSVTAFAANSDAASGPPVTSEGSETRPMAQLHLHIPSEAYFMTTMIQEVPSLLDPSLLNIVVAFPPRLTETDLMCRLTSVSFSPAYC